MHGTARIMDITIASTVPGMIHTGHKTDGRVRSVSITEATGIMDGAATTITGIALIARDGIRTTLRMPTGTTTVIPQPLS
jgi:hypothetical protein